MRNFSRRGAVLYRSYTEKSTVDRNYLKYLKFKRKILHNLYTNHEIKRGFVCYLYKIILSQNLLSFFSGWSGWSQTVQDSSRWLPFGMLHWGEILENSEYKEVICLVCLLPVSKQMATIRIYFPNGASIGYRRGIDTLSIPLR